MAVGDWLGRLVRGIGELAAGEIENQRVIAAAKRHGQLAARVGGQHIARGRSDAHAKRHKRQRQ